MENFIKEISHRILELDFIQRLKIIFINHHTHTYIYENEIPNIYGDDLKKYVQENKAISEYSLKELYVNEISYKERHKKYGQYVIKDNKIHIMPFDQYREMQKRRGK